MNEKAKQAVTILAPAGILCLCLICTVVLYLQTCQETAYRHVSAFFEIAAEQEPESEQQLLKALKEYAAVTEQEIRDGNYLAAYGYGPGDFCRGSSGRILLLFSGFFLIAAGTFAFTVRRLYRQNRRRILELTEYLEEINTGTGEIRLKSREDDFSQLQDEIYKTVTMLRQTREMAVASKRRFAENLENIAHQLKTPITAASLSVQLMEKTAVHGEPVWEYADQIERQLKRLNCLEESLLTLSRIDAGTLPMKYEKVDVYTVLSLAEENIHDLLQKTGVSIAIPEKGCVEFYGDLEWTMEAVINLMKNCMEHSVSGGQIYCDYSENPLYTEILIWDEGTGFEPADIPHLFERFYRGGNASSNGIGIGLAFARSVFELQRGTLTARNLKTGGACFEIRLYSH